MNLSDYVNAALETAMYPDIGCNQQYPFLGLCGEFGETCEKIKKLLRDGGGIVTDAFKENFIKEVGDYLWYASALIREFKIDPKNFVAHHEFSAMHNYAVTQSYPTSTFNAVRSVMRHIGEIGTWVHTPTEPNYVMQDCDKATVANNIMLVMLKLACICLNFGLNIEDAAQQNILKLRDRRSRNVIQGSGDNR